MMFQSSIVLFLLGAAVAQVQDQTRVPGAHGSDIVAAVVSQIRKSCIFPDDKLFLRRLAYVETHDGDDPKTYRAGYDGGIWQIDEDKFNLIKGNGKATALFSAVNSRFAIDWTTVQWSDLRKPLYSGLAAALYLSTITEEVKRSVENQGPFYAKYFRTGPDAGHDFYVGANGLKNRACTRSYMDLAFIVDSSTSLSRTDFANAKQFANDVVDNFKIGPQDVRVAFVTFSSGYRSEFDFNKYTDKAALQKAIDGVAMVPGVTDTDKALDFAADSLFTPSMGSRDGASKVILLLTDGRSTHPLLTVPAALKARNKGIIIFAIGVGSVDRNELNDVATAPQCTHVIQLAGYGDLSALVSEIQQVSCESAAVLTPGPAYTFPCGKGGLYQFVTNNRTTLVTVQTTDGTVDLFGSLNNPTPSAAVNSFSSQAGSVATSVVLISQENRPVYLTVSASAPPNTCKGSYTVKVGSVERIKANTHVMCVEADLTSNCNVAKVYGYIYILLSPPYRFTNPCKPGEPSFQPHPLDQTRFLFCENNGKVYSIQCPSNHIYRPSLGLAECVPRPTSPPVVSTPTSPPVVVTTPRRITNPPGGFVNPCTPEHKAANMFFFPYPPDEKKYIDCTNWPALGYIKDCQKWKVWNDHYLTCTYKYVVINITVPIFSHIPNPCVNAKKTGDLFYYPHPVDPHKYIQCDQFGDAFEKTCPLTNEVWHEELLQCIPDKLIVQVG